MEQEVPSPVMPEAPAPPSSKPKFKFFGEYRWEKFLYVGASGICFLVAWKDSGGVIAFLKSGAFHGSLLFILWFYLSEMSYRLFQDIRND